MTNSLFTGVRWSLLPIAALVASLVFVFAKPRGSGLPPPVELRGEAALPSLEEFVVVTAPTIRFDDNAAPSPFDDDDDGSGVSGSDESADSVQDSEGSADSPDDED